MATGARPALGLSIGVTNLAAVAADHSITRKPVLTLYRQRPPEVGVPSENPRLDEPGLVITDFVDRVGDSVGIVAADGSVYRSEALVADALLALAYTATGGRALPGSVTVTYPAHWGPAAVAALDSALRRASEWSHGTSSTAQPLSLLPDAAAALYAIRADPGIPARGIVAVCDFGGSGTGITLVDAADEYRPVAATVRHQAFSGDLIDQSLLSYVMSELPGTGAFDPAGTSAIGSLTKLRIECRKAKERLSSSTVTTLTDALGGDIRLTRNELEDTIRDSLDSVGRALEQTLARSGIRTAELVAIVSVGGGANIPAVTTTLSGRFCVPVVRTPRPQLTAAFGGALWAARRPGDTSATVLTAVTSATATARPMRRRRPAARFGLVGGRRGLPHRAGPWLHSGPPVAELRPRCPCGARAQVPANPVVSPAGRDHHRHDGGGVAGGCRRGDRVVHRRPADGAGDPAEAGCDHDRRTAPVPSAGIRWPHYRARTSRTGASHRWARAAAAAAVAASADNDEYATGGDHRCHHSGTDDPRFRAAGDHAAAGDHVPQPSTDPADPTDSGDSAAPPRNTSGSRDRAVQRDFG